MIQKFKTFSKDQAKLLGKLFGFKKAEMKGKILVSDTEMAVLSIFPRSINSYPYPDSEEDLSGGFDGRFLKRAIQILEELLNDELVGLYTGPTATPIIFLGKKFEIHLAPKRGNKIKEDVIDLMAPKKSEEEYNDVQN